MFQDGFVFGREWFRLSSIMVEPRSHSVCPGGAALQGSIVILGRAGTDRALELFDSAILRLVRNLTFPILLRA
jgi:hypothetical protein